MKKILLIIFFLFLLLFGLKIETGEGKRLNEIVYHQEISEASPIATMEKAVKTTLFVFLVPVILFFIAFACQYIKNVTFKYRIKEKFKYRKQLPRSELALNINIG